MLVTLLGMVTLVKELPSNAWFPMLVTLFGILIDPRRTHKPQWLH
jgi:hypothetical protein